MIATYTQSCPQCAMPIIKGVTIIVYRAGKWTHVDCELMLTPEQYPLREVKPVPAPTARIPQLGVIHSEYGLTRHAIYAGEQVTVCGRINRDQLTLGAGPSHTSWCGLCYQTIGSELAHAAYYGVSE